MTTLTPEVLQRLGGFLNAVQVAAIEFNVSISSGIVEADNAMATLHVNSQGKAELWVGE